MDQQPGKLFLVSLTVLRCLLAAWIGAAVLFVITSVAEQTSGNFDSVVRDQLAVIRFPHYYRFGFGLYAACGLLAMVVWRTALTAHRRRFLAVLLLIAISAVLITLDYQLVYLPLEAAITPPGQARTQEFIRLHNLSRHANEAHLTLMALAAIVAAVPCRLPPRTSG
ncbi:MAG: hypothetical protein RIK87_13080 [Fuerstiella sp.]